MPTRRNDWGNDPKYVIALLQFMQFGYAVMVSVAIIVWDEISTSDYSVLLYLALVGFCYAIVVLVAAQIVPQYTMCTSLAQLIDEETYWMRLFATIVWMKPNKKARSPRSYRTAMTIMIAFQCWRKPTIRPNRNREGVR